MSIERVISPQLPEPPPGLWSNALRVGDMLFISGLTARDAQLKVVGDDEYAQAQVIFARMSHLLKSAGATERDVIKLNLYLTDIDRREGVWKARAEFFTGSFPTATLVEVSSLQPDVLVEIEAVAYLNQGGRPDEIRAEHLQ
jgi:enamine deaminase RidA (YjgF/YER057c/UK114 family)